MREGLSGLKLGPGLLACEPSFPRSLDPLDSVVFGLYVVCSPRTILAVSREEPLVGKARRCTLRPSGPGDLSGAAPGSPHPRCCLPGSETWRLPAIPTQGGGPAQQDRPAAVTARGCPESKPWGWGLSLEGGEPEQSLGVCGYRE